MGCGLSKETNRAQGDSLVIGAPTEVSIHIPRNRTDPHGLLTQTTTHEMDRLTLQNALHMMSYFLHQRNVQLTVIALGGAVSTLFLGTRNSTHDIDVFGSNLDNAARILLDEAMQYAIQQSSSPLGTDWFNTENQMWMSPTVHRELTNEAIQQNVVVFNRPGLRVLAAPWEYAFSGKVSRLLIGGNQIRQYDLSDAVHYLNQIVNRYSGNPVPIATVEGWARRFQHNTSKHILDNRVNVEYRRQFGSDGIR